MTATVNGTSHHVTDGSDVQSCVRAPLDPGEAPVSGGGAGSIGHAGGHARAIPDQDEVASDSHTANGRNFASPHLREARQAFAGAWPFRESPPPAAEMWRQALPGKGEAANWLAWVGAAVAGLFRAAVVNGCWLVALSVAGEICPDGRRTRIRAGVALSLLTLAVAASVLLPH